jgi:hypothetical protein
VRRSSEDATRRECNAVGATRRMQRGGCNAAECNAIGRRRASFVATHSPAGDRVPAANPGAPRDRAPRVASAPGSLPGARSGTDQCRQSHGHGRVVPHEVDAGMGDAQRQHGHGERATAAPTALLQPGERPDKDPEKQAKPDQTDLRTDLKRCVMGPAGIPVAASSSTIGSGSRGGQPADQPCPPDERHKQPDADHLAPPARSPSMRLGVRSDRAAIPVPPLVSRSRERHRRPITVPIPPLMVTTGLTELTKVERWLLARSRSTPQSLPSTSISASLSFNLVQRPTPTERLATLFRLQRHRTALLSQTASRGRQHVRGASANGRGRLDLSRSRRARARHRPRA